MMKVMTLSLAPTIFFLILVWLGTYWASPKFSIIAGLVLAGWLAAVALLGKAGVFAMTPLLVPNIVFGFLIIFEFWRRILSSHVFYKNIEGISVSWLTLAQTYRVVGIVFIFLYLEGVLPAVFAFPAAIGDIITGCLAPFVAYAYYKKTIFYKHFAIAWNIFGIADLIVAIAAGVLAFSWSVQFLPVTPPTNAIATYPLVLVPLFAVPLAFVLHIVSLKIIKKSRS